jgi:hypothetical protein
MKTEEWIRYEREREEVERIFGTSHLVLAHSEYPDGFPPPPGDLPENGRSRSETRGRPQS